MVQTSQILELRPHGDARGKLLALEANRELLPFEVRRVYFMYGIPDGAERGKHAHLDTRQVLICVHGAFTIDLEFGGTRPSETYRLDSPEKGLLLEGLVWRSMRDFAPGTVIAVLADEHYDVASPKEIREYSVFLSKVKSELGK